MQNKHNMIIEIKYQQCKIINVLKRIREGDYFIKNYNVIY